VIEIQAMKKIFEKGKRSNGKRFNTEALKIRIESLKRLESEINLLSINWTV
jgi:hypothetical protein